MGEHASSASFPLSFLDSSFSEDDPAAFWVAPVKEGVSELIPALAGYASGIWNSFRPVEVFPSNTGMSRSRSLTYALGICIPRKTGVVIYTKSVYRTIINAL